MRPHQLDHLHEPPPALDLDVGLLVGIEAVEARDVRAVAPHDPRARRQQPPHVPGAAEQLLDLAIERLERGWILAARTPAAVGVHVGQPVDGVRM